MKKPLAVRHRGFVWLDDCSIQAASFIGSALYLS